MFQSTHPRGVRPGNAPSSFGPRRFQSTHPRGVRPRTAAKWPAGMRFQSTHPRGVRLPPWRPWRPWRSCFNPRTRVGCDGEQLAIHHHPMKFQSTHPRGVRPGHMAGGVQQQAVSIHAPAWGATPAGGAQAGQEPVSIHAPAWGATSAHSLYSHRPEAFQSTHPRGVRHGKSLTVSGTTLCFNPRTRVGCDGFGVAVIGAPVAVSIHAPAWGATERDNERDA